MEHAKIKSIFTPHKYLTRVHYFGSDYLMDISFQSAYLVQITSFKKATLA